MMMHDDDDDDDDDDEADDDEHTGIQTHRTWQHQDMTTAIKIGASAHLSTLSLNRPYGTYPP